MLCKPSFFRSKQIKHDHFGCGCALKTFELPNKTLQQLCGEYVLKKWCFFVSALLVKLGQTLTHLRNHRSLL